jgi:predicted metal-dependent hydrolase
VRGLPLLNQDKIWNRVRHVGLDELMQFDWTLVGESDALSGDLGRTPVLDEIDVTALDGRLRKIREVIADRRRYLEILA